MMLRKLFTNYRIPITPLLWLFSERNIFDWNLMRLVDTEVASINGVTVGFFNARYFRTDAKSLVLLVDILDEPKKP